VAQLIEMTLQQPGVSDRLNGRKMYAQLRRAGFRQVTMHVKPSDTAGMTFYYLELAFGAVARP
jgi:hypothetical protein